MSRKKNGINWSKTVPAKSRRARAIERLENQLKEGTKTSKEGDKKVPLNEKDTNRINREIEILTKRI
jgi:hypothetical protein